MGKTKLNGGRKKAESERHYVASRRERRELPDGTLLVGHGPHGKISNNGNGLILDVRAASNMLMLLSKKYCN